MNLYSCRLTGDECHILIVAETARKAKPLFWHNRIEENWEDKYTDVRATALQRNVPYPPGVYATDEEEWTHEWYCRRVDSGDEACSCWWCRNREEVE